MRELSKKIFFIILSSSLFVSDSIVAAFFRRIMYILLLNRLGKASVKDIHGFLWRCNFSIRGKNNKIEIHNKTMLFKCRLEIRGSNNTLEIGKECIFGEVLWGLRDNGSVVKIGDRTQGLSDTFCAMEGRKVEVGEDTLFSYRVEVRNTDSHSIIDKSGKRTNSAEDVFIGNHVWIAQDSLILKGSYIPDNSIVGAKSLVNKKFTEEGSILVGTPAKALKSGYNWTKQRQ